MALFDYGNTRLRARLSNLLSIDQLVSFTDYTSVDSFLSALTKTQYKESIETALTFAHGYACLSQAMRMELAQISEDLNRFYQDEEARLVTLIFMRDDLLNLKAIVRGHIHKISMDEVEDSFLALGSISLVYLKELAKAKNLNDVVNKMVVYQLPAAQTLLAMRPSKKKLTSADVELALEKWFFQQVQDALKGNSESIVLLREFYAIEADTINLNTALSVIQSPAKFEGEPVGKYMFAEGNLPLRRMIKLSQLDSVEDAVRSLFATKYGTYLKKGMVCYTDTQYLSEFENQMRMYLINWLSKLPKLFPLGIGVPLGYYARKRTEIYNLRWIGKGIESGFEPAYIRENLVSVQ